MEQKSSESSPNPFEDQKKLHDALEAKRQILEKAHQVLPELPEPYEPTPIAYGEHFINHNELAKIITLRREITRVMKAPESLGTVVIEVNPKTGKKIYAFNQGDWIIRAADPSDDTSLNLRHVKGKRTDDIEFLTIHGMLEDYPASLSMGAFPEIHVKFPDLLQGDENVFASERREWNKITDTDAVLASHLIQGGIQQILDARNSAA